MADNNNVSQTPTGDLASGSAQTESTTRANARIDFCEGIIPQTYVIPSEASTTAKSGLGDRVAIIGAFPKVSQNLEYYTNYRTACSGLEIINGVNDEYSEPSEEAIRSKNYFAGAGSLRYLFHSGTLDETVSSVLVCNYTTYATTTDTDGSASLKCDPTTGENVFDTGLELSDDILEKLQPNEKERNNPETKMTKLDVALNQLKNEEFDILLLAFAPTVNDVKKIIAWEREVYTQSNPIGVVFGTSEKQLKVIKSIAGTSTFTQNNDGLTTTSIVQSVVNGSVSESIDVSSVIDILNEFSKAKINRHENHTLYGCIPQGYKLAYEDKYLTPVESAAYYCGKIASLRVNKSMTNRLMDHVVDVNEDLVYTRTFTADNLSYYDSDGYKLVDAGATMVRCTNRTSREYAVVNSQQPCGLDLAHLRTTAYIVKRLGLKPYLGKLNNITNIDLITSRLSTVKNTLIGMFDILDSIEYSVERASKNCVKIYLRIVYYGILLNEVIYVSEEVI